MKNQMKNQIKNSWKTLLKSIDATHAATLAYNPHCRGSHAAVFRVRPDSTRVQLPTRVDKSNRLTTSRNITTDQVRRDVGLLARKLDRRLLGPRHHHKPRHLWSSFIGFVEHPDSNLHVHLLWRCCDPNGIAGAEIVKQWEGLSPYFTADASPLTDALGWTDYLLKDQSPTSLLDPCGLILSTAR